MMISDRTLPGVLYAEDFDLPDDMPVAARPEVQPAIEPVVLEPTFSLVDLQRASERALQEGRAIERKTVEQAIEARRLDALCQIAEMLRASKAECARVASSDAASTARVVLAAVAAVLPALAAANGLPEVRCLLDLLIPAMESIPKLQIRVHPALIDSLSNDLESLASAESIILEWVGVEAMELGDVSVKWPDGVMVRDTRLLCSQICALLVPDQRVSTMKGC